jgi:hypothetical protein
MAEGEQFSDYVNPGKLQKRHTLQEGHSPDKLKQTVNRDGSAQYDTSEREGFYNRSS